MSIKKILTSVGLALSLSFGAVSGASAVSLEEFDGVEKDKQSKVIAAVLNAYYNHYSSDKSTAYKAQCMAELYKPASNGSGSRLLGFIVDDLDKARQDKSHTYTVESIVENIISRECSTNIAGTPQPPNGPG
ncbi:MAG: hypothetical protein H6867_06520 [Rhodospirillales bacterium]|nr:hypothetical protein [Rhodospirillales bacterium]MCB9995203.1 hypothetical protein [Rhodospirillales bacterium]